MEEVLSTGTLTKERLVHFARTIIGDNDDAYALVHEIVPDEDNKGDLGNLVKRIECKMFLTLLQSYLTDPASNKLETIRQSHDSLMAKLYSLVNRSQEGNKKEIHNPEGQTKALNAMLGIKKGD